MTQIATGPLTMEASGRDAAYAVPQRPIPGVRDVVLVSSGKGGVGKSTVSVNLAAALSAIGRRVGLLDADIYGPSIARMLGTDTGIEFDPERRIRPKHSHGIHSLSVANVLPPEAALAWKGALVAQTLEQMFFETAWPDLDLLLVDLPPGTGDVVLTILEQVPVAGALIVTTPHKLALADVERGIALFSDLDTPVFGLIENMAGILCPHCGASHELFGAGAAEALAQRRHIRYLGGIPADPGAQATADQGVPLLLSRADSAAARAFAGMAAPLVDALERERRARLRDADPATRAAHEVFWERLLDDQTQFTGDMQ